MKKNQCEKFGKRLAEQRESKGLTQSQLSKSTDIQRVTIAKYETGERAPSIDNLLTLSSFFGISTDYLLGLSDLKSNDPELKSVCNYLGLSEKSVDTIIQITNQQFDYAAPSDKQNLSAKPFKMILNKIFECPLFPILLLHYHNLYFLSNLEKDIEKDFNINSWNDAVETTRYTISRIHEDMIDIFDNRINEKSKRVHLELYDPFKSILDSDDFKSKEASDNGKHKTPKE